MVGLHPVSIPCPMHLFQQALPELPSFVINWQSSKQNVSSGSMSCSSKLFENKERVVGISSLYLVGQKICACI